MSVDKGSAEGSMINWLEEAARYFESRPTKGEDSAHWANVTNAENARKIAAWMRTKVEPVSHLQDQGGEG